MARQRYVIRLHKLIRKEFDIIARKKGHLTATFIAKVLEEICDGLDISGYEIHPDSEAFQLKRGNSAKGNVKSNADKQMSIYLSDFTYELIEKLVEKLQEEVDRNISPSYVIRDLLFHWLDRQGSDIEISYEKINSD